jgi:hypothetical protein
MWSILWKKTNRASACSKGRLGRRSFKPCLTILEDRLTPASLDFFTTTFSSSSFPAVGGAYQDVGSPLTFTADGSPVRLSAAVQISNQSSTIPALQQLVRLTVDGAPVGKERYVTVAASGYAEVSLEELVSGLAPGAHTVGVQAEDPAGEPPVRIDAGSTINAVQFRTIVVPPPPPSSPPPAATNLHISASLIIKKVGKKKVLFIHLTFSDGRAAADIRSPFQSPAFRGIKVAVKDANGDGSDDSILLTGKKGKKKLTQTLAE